MCNARTGLWEVAKELQDPFKNAPNDLPLNNYQAQFNEALLMMYSGYVVKIYFIIEHYTDFILLEISYFV